MTDGTPRTLCGECGHTVSIILNFFCLLLQDGVRNLLDMRYNPVPCAVQRHPHPSLPPLKGGYDPYPGRMPEPDNSLSKQLVLACAGQVDDPCAQYRIKRFIARNCERSRKNVFLVIRKTLQDLIGQGWITLQKISDFGCCHVASTAL